MIPTSGTLNGAQVNTTPANGWMPPPGPTAAPLVLNTALTAILLTSNADPFGIDPARTRLVST